VTGAQVTPETVRIERYGRYLVLHNPAETAVQATVASAESGEELAVNLPAQGTVVVRVR